MRTVISLVLAALLALVAIAGQGCSTAVIELAPDGGNSDLTSTPPSDLTMPPTGDLTMPPTGDLTMPPPFDLT